MVQQGTVKGDIEFGNNLKTENGADIDGYIKKTNKSKSTLTGDFLFQEKRRKKEPSETEERPEVVNKRSFSLIYRTLIFKTLQYNFLMENYKCKSVGIVGSGIQGVCTGLQLIKKGIPVTIFDRQDPLSSEY